MSKYDIVNGKWTFRATPLDYLHCIFNEYEWLMLLKGCNKPYEEILDPLYDIARKERYEDEELADIKITMKWLGERLKVNTNYFSKLLNIFRFSQSFQSHKTEEFTHYDTTPATDTCGRGGAIISIQ